MRILMAITYYKPYVSGLTVYVERLSAELTARGHEVTVLTSQFDSSLPLSETRDGVNIARVPVGMRVSKAVVMPRYLTTAIPLLREHDLVNMHLPQPESSLLSFLAHRVVNRPKVVTYHCDVNLPASLLNKGIDEAAFVNNWITGSLADAIVAYTDDYAQHSRFLKRFPRKRRIIPPPVSIPAPDRSSADALRTRLDLGDATVIGFAARFATEKGVEVLLDALPRIQAELGDVRILFAGPWENVIGEERYLTRLLPRLKALGRAWTFLGTLSPRQLADFYSVCALTVLPSINSTESFGMVQVESMLTGTPVCASSLPGVRVPIQSTGMGIVVPIGDASALASAVVEIVRNRARYVRPRAEIEQLFSIRRTADGYTSLYESLIGARSGVGTIEVPT
jgi:glycosyltransferase involved in cell wall biosynthesis